MRSYIERAKDFVESVYPFIEKNIYNCDYVERAIDKFNSEYNRKVICTNGAVRIALITSDYVVKYNYNDEEVPFLGGGEQEIRIYSRAKADGFGYLFAPITRYVYKNTYFYIMPRINGIGKEEYDDTYADELMDAKESRYISELGLNDLHNYNFGFRRGKVCLVDYACQYGYSNN